ncbi:MAG TPA: RNA methyltransferase [Limnobacter sp.]|uniref:RNA methyltransferase n=1 Tax=Limnobacter sp. TaxID=2003368 RepID=UPI002EDA5906
MSLANSLASISIVLVKTSHPGNVGSVARAMKTMGLGDLRLVSPRFDDIASQEEAIALASGAVDVLQQARVYNSLPEALYDCHRSYALSARMRELGPLLQSPAVAAAEVFEAHVTRLKSAFVFGAERTGLTNEELQQCNRQVYIPSNPVYNSLNLSQAVQIVCYALRVEGELREGADVPQVPNPEKRSAPVVNLATAEAVAQLQAHWLTAMERVDFLNPDRPKKLIQRLTRLLGKAQLEQEEVDMLRGFLSDVVRVADGRLYPHEAERQQSRSE